MLVQGFGVTSRSTVDTRKLDPTAIVVFHQAYVVVDILIPSSAQNFDLLQGCRRVPSGRGKRLSLDQFIHSTQLFTGHIILK